MMAEKENEFNYNYTDTPAPKKRGRPPKGSKPYTRSGNKAAKKPLKPSKKPEPQILNRGDLSRRLKRRTGMSIAEWNDCLDAVFDEIKNAVEEDKVVRIQGFGRFELKERKSHLGRNPNSREAYVIPEHKAFMFTASRTYKRGLRKVHGTEPEKVDDSHDQFGQFDGTLKSLGDKDDE